MTSHTEQAVACKAPVPRAAVEELELDAGLLDDHHLSLAGTSAAYMSTTLTTLAELPRAAHHPAAVPPCAICRLSACISGTSEPRAPSRF